jgi:hypothetical protein
MQPFLLQLHYQSKITAMKYLIILCLLALAFTSESQCCPYINNIEVIPASPTTTDNVKIATTVTTPNLGIFLSSSHSVIGLTINAEACYFNGGLTAPQVYYDTLDIGTLNAGTYDVDFTAYQSLDTTMCTYTDTMTSNYSFTVTDGTSSVHSITQQIGKLYPNPSNGKFTIQLSEGIGANRVRICSISGELIYQVGFQEEMNLNLESGIYLIEFWEGDSILGYQRLVLQ